MRSYPGLTRPIAQPSGRSAVPLSEHEQRLLDQIERALYAEDPKFASTVRATDLRTHLRRRIRSSVGLFVFGVALTLGGLIAQTWPVSVVGFLVMLGAALRFATSWKRIGGPDTPRLRARRGTGRPASGGRQPRPARPARPAKPSGSF